MATAPGKKERYEALVEDIKSDVQLVFEGHSTLDEKIEVLRQDMGMVKDERGHVGKAARETNQRLETPMNRLEAHDHVRTSSGIFYWRAWFLPSVGF